MTYGQDPYVFIPFSEKYTFFLKSSNYTVSSKSVVTIVDVITGSCFLLCLAVVLVLSLILLLRSFYYCSLKVSEVQNAVV